MAGDSNSPDDGIRRRDFLNGVLLAAGGTAVQSFFPRRALADPTCAVVPINTDPRALRSGNIPSTFNVAHWMRDRRLGFSASTVTLAPGRFDATAGTFPVHEDADRYDVVIVGSGISALASAFFLSRERPGVRILMLDANALPGGNASRDEGPPLPIPAGTGAVYCVAPYADFLTDFYEGIGIDWERYAVAAPFYSYYFDSNTPHINPGARGWNLDSYDTGMRDMPYAPQVIRDLHRSRQDFRNWYARHGAPTDPADGTDPRYDHLAQITLDQYLTGQGYHPAVSDFYTRYSVDALAGTSAQVNALSSISFIGAEYNPIFALPGGNAGVSRLAANLFIPGSVEGATTDERLVNPLHVDRLDAPGNRVRMRQLTVAVRADTGPGEASVVYWRGGAFHRVRARAVIVAGQAHSAQHLVDHLLTANVRAAWDDFTMVPVVTANVAIRSAAPLVDLGLGFNQYWWGSRFWADFVTADWTSERRHDRNRSTVLTFLGANTLPPEEMAAERVRLLTTPFCDYESSLREDLNRVLADAPGGFDFDRDVTAVFVYRWGHGMIYPKVGFPFGPPQNREGRVVRTPAARHLARQPLDRIFFAGQDVESTPSIESAIGSGLRVTGEILPRL